MITMYFIRNFMYFRLRQVDHIYNLLQIQKTIKSFDIEYSGSFIAEEVTRLNGVYQGAARNAHIYARQRRYLRTPALLGSYPKSSFVASVTLPNVLRYGNYAESDISLPTNLSCFEVYTCHIG
jgi:hypothetical protein